jgi:hypothetical protein
MGSRYLSYATTLFILALTLTLSEAGAQSTPLDSLIISIIQNPIDGTLKQCVTCNAAYISKKGKKKIAIPAGQFFGIVKLKNGDEICAGWAMAELVKKIQKARKSNDLKTANTLQKALNKLKELGEKEAESCVSTGSGQLDVTLSGLEIAGESLPSSPLPPSHGHFCFMSVVKVEFGQNSISEEIFFLNHFDAKSVYAAAYGVITQWYALTLQGMFPNTQPPVIRMYFSGSAWKALSSPAEAFQYNAMVTSGVTESLQAIVTGFIGGDPKKIEKTIAKTFEFVRNSMGIICTKD